MNYRVAVAIISLFITATVGCTKPVPPEMEKAVQTIHYFVTPAFMNRSAFFAGRASMKPSEYAEYLFTEAGSAEWPPVEGSRDLAPDEEKALKAGGFVLLPKDYAIVYRFPDTTKGKQIVISGDDDKGILVAQAYIDPREKPVIRRGWMIVPLFRSTEQTQQQQMDIPDIPPDTQR